MGTERRSVVIRPGVLVFLALAASACSAPDIGSGLAAKRVCSEIFLAERNPAGAFHEELAIVPTAMDLRVDRTAKTVTASTWGMGERKAVWRPDEGCLLVPANGVAGHERFAVAPRPRGRTAARQPAPDDRLADAIAWAFEERDPAHPIHTRAVVVLHEGRLKAERYAPGFGPHTPMLGWSLSKSASHALVGLAVRQHGLDPHAPVGFSEWAADGRAAITAEHLLRMTSGLAFDESPSLWNDVNTMLFLTADMAAFAAERPLEHPPGSHWSYASGSSLLIHRLLRRHLGDAAYHRFPRDALFDPIGADSALWETDSAGTFVGSSYLYMSARDWARLGLLYLRDGVWNGTRLLPEGWAADACKPTAVAPGGRYGSHWWVNGGAGRALHERSFPALPGDMCWASGFEQQWVILVPGHDLVIVRLGVTPHTSDFDVSTFVTRIMEAVR